MKLTLAEKRLAHQGYAAALKDAERPPYRRILAEIAAVIRPTGLCVNDLPTVIACWIAGDDGDDLGPDVVCRLTSGEFVHWNNDRIELRGAIRVAGYAR